MQVYILLWIWVEKGIFPSNFQSQILKPLSEKTWMSFFSWLWVVSLSLVAKGQAAFACHVYPKCDNRQFLNV